MLVTSRDLLVPARKCGYAVPALNVQNMESVKAVSEAAEEHSPAIMQVTPSVLKYAGLEYIRALARCPDMHPAFSSLFLSFSAFFRLFPAFLP